MTESPWLQLYRVSNARRAHLGLTMRGLREAGGPSPAWVHKLIHVTGSPSVRHAASLADLDRALQWPPGTSWAFLTADRTGWTVDDLDAETARLRDVEAGLSELEELRARIARLEARTCPCEREA